MMHLFVISGINRLLSSLFVLALPGILLFPLPAFPASNEQAASADTDTALPPPEGEFKRLEVVFEPDAYYTNMQFILALTRAPVPRIGERSEREIYATLLSRAALLPRFLVLEASVNPLPYLGVYVRKHEPGLYEEAQISGSFNLVQALTAGFEEPYALSLLAGNVVAFDVPGRSEIKGLGYSGYLYSAGNYHIKDNTLIHDRWQELEWKMKGDRKSPVKKLSWSFRIGGKLHDHPDILDILYLSFRRSRLDYKQEGNSLLHNSGFEYTVDLNLDSCNAVRHYFTVDKKWPLENRQMAFTLAAGFIWESAERYSGTLATGQSNNFQFLLQPNIAF